MILSDSLIVNGTATIQNTGTLELQNNTTLAGTGTSQHLFQDRRSTMEPGLSNINFGAGIQVYNNSELRCLRQVLISDRRDDGEQRNNQWHHLYLTNYYFAEILSEGRISTIPPTGTVHFNTHAHLEPWVSGPTMARDPISPNNDLQSSRHAAGWVDFHWIEDGELRDDGPYTANIDFAFAMTRYSHNGYR